MTEKFLTVSIGGRYVGLNRIRGGNALFSMSWNQPSQEVKTAPRDSRFDSIVAERNRLWGTDSLRISMSMELEFRIQKCMNPPL
jgi:hypothetical protein